MNNSNEKHLVKVIHISVGRRIKQIREKKRMSQEQLASKCGISLNALARLETGEGRLTLKTLLAIAEQLQTTAHQLLKGIA